MISNREDALIIIEFLQSIKERTGIIKTKWVMTDDAPQFYTAWRAVFGNHDTKKILCAWHVDRSWRNALREQISSKASQVEVYHQLRVLLHETKESHFRVLLQEVLTYIQKHHKKFYAYFNTRYCTRLNEWSSCYRTK